MDLIVDAPDTTNHTVFTRLLHLTLFSFRDTGIFEQRYRKPGRHPESQKARQKAISKAAKGKQQRRRRWYRSKKRSQLPLLIGFAVQTWLVEHIGYLDNLML